MSANRQTVSKVISFVLLALLVVGIIGFAAFFTNGFSEDFKTFYVEHNGEQIVSNESKLTFKTANELRFDCKYIVGENADEQQGYTVKIVPKITNDTRFDFTVDGVPYSYAGEKDLTSAFNIERYNDYFIIHIPEEMSMLTILQNLYKDKQVDLPVALDESKYYYTMLISSYDESITYSIDFRFYFAVTGVELEDGIVL